MNLNKKIQIIIFIFKGFKKLQIWDVTSTTIGVLVSPMVEEAEAGAEEVDGLTTSPKAT